VVTVIAPWRAIRCTVADCTPIVKSRVAQESRSCGHLASVGLHAAHGGINQVSSRVWE
jgi:hypothetical protein